ncbi:hypothetical protein ACWGJ2_12450 [Streptomyces sp. NPDC054796]
MRSFDRAAVSLGGLGDLRDEVIECQLCSLLDVRLESSTRRSKWSVGHPGWMNDPSCMVNMLPEPTHASP